ncbi:MAG: universal stress protein [Nitrospira sp.]|nr:universal stress protein [Nitrospira sp.]
MNIVIAVDRSRHARAAMQLLQHLRWPAGSAFTLLHMLEMVTIPGGWQLHYHPELWKQLTGERRKVFSQAQRFLERLGTQVRPGDARPEVLVKWGLPLTGIVGVLKKKQADLVVVGSRGLSGVRRFLLGSVSEGVLHSAPCSVLISRGSRKRGAQPSVKGLRILLAVDESDHALAAAQAMIRVTKERGRQVLGRMRKLVAHRGLTIHPVLVEGRPAEEILRAAARTHADLVILGSRGMTGLKGAFLGSVSRKVARHAPCSVLVVKQR